MTQYKFNINGSLVTGNLAWNQNGTLRSLAIPSDPFNSSNVQTCTYGYDDLVRLASVGCGSVWAQTFSYDQFGNISKSGSLSFQPTYNYATNRISSLPGASVSYDANGNMTNDSARTYTWTAENRPCTIGSVITTTYDALGRPVERASGSSYAQMVYSPLGGRLAIMNGQTLAKGFAGVPGGGTAIYQASGLAWYRHGDWLGSSRLASTPGRTVSYDAAYAPFGEPYAETGTTDRSFTGKDEDSTSGLYDFPARIYSPTQGRWISPDPAGLRAMSLARPQSLNRYVYVSNNPLASVDPKGLSEEHCMIDPRDCLGTTDDLWGVNSGMLVLTLFQSERGAYFYYDCILCWMDGNGGWEGGDPPEPPADPCDDRDPTNHKILSFIATYRDKAQAIANRFVVPVANILGLAYEETNGGTSQITRDTHNFFNLTCPVNQKTGTLWGNGSFYSNGATGCTPPAEVAGHGNGWFSYVIYPEPGFTNSGNALADVYASRFFDSDLAVERPEVFAQFLSDLGFNRSRGFVGLVTDTINLTIKRRMNCPH